MKNLLIQLSIIFITSIFLYANKNNPGADILILSKKLDYKRENDKIFLPNINYNYKFSSSTRTHQENKSYKDSKIPNLFTSLRRLSLPAYNYNSKGIRYPQYNIHVTDMSRSKRKLHLGKKLFQQGGRFLLLRLLWGNVSNILLWGIENDGINSSTDSSVGSFYEGFSNNIDIISLAHLVYWNLNEKNKKGSFTSRDYSCSIPVYDINQKYDINIKGEEHSFNFKKRLTNKIISEENYSHKEEIIKKVNSYMEKVNPGWIRSVELVNRYNAINSTDKIVSEVNKNLSRLGVPKGEFESTTEFSVRYSKEKFTRERLVAQFDQDIRIAIQNEKKEKRAILDELNQLIKNIVHYRDSDFDISRYDADNQIFTIFNNEISNDIYIPKSDAPEFKHKKIGDYVLTNQFAPDLDGKWKPIYPEPFLALDSDRNNRINWIQGDGQFIPSDIDKIVPPKIDVSYLILDMNGNQFKGNLNAGEKYQIQLSLKNIGKGDASDFAISLIQSSGQKINNDYYKEVGKIISGGFAQKIFAIDIPEDILNGKIDLEFSYSEKNGFSPPSRKLKFDTKSISSPLLSLSDFSINDYDNDGRVDAGESAKIVARITNSGEGMAQEVVVYIHDDKKNKLYLAPGMEEKYIVGNLYPGQSKDIEFEVSTSGRTEKISNLYIDILERRARYDNKGLITVEIDKLYKDSLSPLEFAKIDGAYNDSMASLNIDIEKNIPKGKRNNKNAYAIVIGNKNYGGDVPDVDYALRDAEFIKRYLINTFGYDKDKIQLLENATLSQMKTAFVKLNNRIKNNKNAEVFFYYSGHGAPNTKTKKAYLVPVDCDPNYVQTGGYSVGDLYKELNAINAEYTTVVLDACFSGGSSGGMLIQEASPLSIRVNNEELNTDNFTIFTSSSGQELSSWLRDKKHSLFTYFFLKGIQGDANINGDDKITVNELEDYLKTNVRSKALIDFNRDQTPQIEYNINSQTKIMVEYD